MSKYNQRTIEVCAHWSGLSLPILMGTLHVISGRGNEIFSFEYNDDWLKSRYACVLDPGLHLFSGKQYAPSYQENFSVFLDSSPDRWGRFLMKRREAYFARQEKREERKLLESDFLLGVYDEYRTGALRFRVSSSGPFLDNNKSYASPPWARLRELEQACLEIEKNDSEAHPGFSKWLQMLIAPGGSLGGARPKASVVDEKNNLWIAKFPSNNDDHDVGAWEMLLYNLGKHAKISMPEAKIKKFNSRYHTFLSKRFDRISTGDRIHFASAMTLLQHNDGDDASAGVSYLELAQFIMQQGARPLEDLEQLWRRIVFFICVSNTDDHLRNHGFILEPGRGWLLSPAFDVNPVADSYGLKLNISENDNNQNLDLAREVAEFFRIRLPRADEIIREVVKAVKNWRAEANLLKIPAREQDYMASAFRVAE